MVELDASSDFEVFVTGTSVRLLRTAWMLTGNWASAEDMTQSALTEAWRHWGRVRLVQSPEAYVRKILVRSFFRLRRHTWFHEVSADFAPELGIADDRIEAVPLHQLLINVMAQLPPQQRAVLALRYFNDLTEREVAKELGCSIGTVKSHAARAIKRLRSVPELQELIMEGSK